MAKKTDRSAAAKRAVQLAAKLPIEMLWTRIAMATLKELEKIALEVRSKAKDGSLTYLSSTDGEPRKASNRDGLLLDTLVEKVLVLQFPDEYDALASDDDGAIWPQGPGPYGYGFHALGMLKGGGRQP